MEGIDWFYLFMGACLFGYLISRDIGMLILKRSDRLEASLLNIESKLNDIESSLQTIQLYVQE